MKKIIYLLSIIVLFLTSCSSGDIQMYKYLFRREGEIANEKFEEIISAIENQEEEELKSLFSKNALSEIEDFSESASTLFDFYKGEMITYDDWSAQNSSAGKSNGKKWKSLQVTYNVETSESIYQFAVKIVIYDTTEPDNVGVSSIYIIDSENSDMQYAYWGDGKWTTGIHLNKKR